MALDHALDTILKRDRYVTIAGIGVMTLLAAIYTIFGIGMSMSAIEMTDMSAGARQTRGMMAGVTAFMPSMTTPAVWDLDYGILVFLMWWVMMIAMMLPSASPMILLYGALSRTTGKGVSVPSVTTSFLLGYLGLWMLFSLIATGLQWVMELRHYISPTGMAVTEDILSGVVLSGAGLYQLTPIKHYCLEKCRSPAQFLAGRRRSGHVGAIILGAEHGVFCLGCCWALMGLLFVGGVMNLYWIAGLAILVAVEKLAPMGNRISQIVGIVLSGWGLVVLANVLF